MRFKHAGKECRNDVAKDDGVADLHHGGLEVHRIEHVVSFCLLQRLAQKSVQGRYRHKRRIHNLTGEHGESWCEDGLGAIGRHVANGQRIGRRHDDRLFV